MLFRSLGAPATGHIADLTVESEVRRLVADVVARHERIDILVNNAGMVSLGTDAESGRLADLSLATWQAGMRRNLDSVFLTTREVVPGMAERGWGRIVSVASVTGPVMAMAHEAAYAAAKAGVVGLMRSVALDEAGRGITANAVAPGWIATGSQTAAEADHGRRTPMGRSGTADEVAAAIAWLCSPAARSEEHTSELQSH